MAKGRSGGSDFKDSTGYDDNGNPVVSSQRWTIDAVDAGIGKITNVKSGLAITANNNTDGTPLRLRDHPGKSCLAALARTQKSCDWVNAENTSNALERVRARNHR